MKALLLVTMTSLLAQAASAQAPNARPDPPALKEITTEFPKAERLEARVLTATVQPGTTSPWHTHPTPVVVYVVEGTFTLELDGREPIQRKAGEALLEPVNVKVRAANHGQSPTKVVIFQVSEPERPFMEASK